MGIESLKKETSDKEGFAEAYEKPQIKALDMSCSQRPDWTCGPCRVFAEDLTEKQS